MQVMYCSKKYKLQSKRRSSNLVSASFRSGSTEMWCWFSTVLLPLSFSAEAAQWFLSWAVNHHRYWAVLKTVTPGRDCILNPETGNSLLPRPIKCFTNANRRWQHGNGIEQQEQFKPMLLPKKSSADCPLRQGIAEMLSRSLVSISPKLTHPDKRRS